MTLNKKWCFVSLFWILILSAYLFVGGCASIQQPMGGPKDSIAPKVVKELPGNLSNNFKAEEIIIEFDEFVTLVNEFQEISISPSMEKVPEYKAKKKILKIKLTDTLEKNTTYSINFGKAIVDINESNVLKNYSYVFSTGPFIDSLSLSGTVSSALTKEKLKDVTVFILPVSRDSLFGKKRASVFTTTDSSGNFILKHLHEDTYRIYALNEIGGGDRIYNSRNEEIGFLKDSLVLTKNLTTINLQVFKEKPETFKITDRKLEADGRLTLVFNQPIEEPVITVLFPPELNTNKIMELTAKKDSAFIWFPELTFDSIQVSIADKNKSLDTVVLRRNKRDTYIKTLTYKDNLSGGKVSPTKGFILTISAPIETADFKKVQLLEDTIPVRRAFDIKKVEGTTRQYLITYPWKQKSSYQLKIPENAFVGSTGAKSVYYTRKFTADSDDNFGILQMAYTVTDSVGNYVVELLNEQKVVIQSDTLSGNKKIAYKDIPTGKYKIRIIYDENKNGKWDSGNLKLRLQPELIYNYDKEIMLRPNWELEEKMVIPKRETESD